MVDRGHRTTTAVLPDGEIGFRNESIGRRIRFVATNRFIRANRRRTLRRQYRFRDKGNETINIVIVTGEHRTFHVTQSCTPRRRRIVAEIRFALATRV